MTRNMQSYENLQYRIYEGVGEYGTPLLEPTEFAELRKRGYKVVKAKNNVEDGIRVVGTKLNQEAIIFADSCVNTIQEFGSYIWDEAAAAHGEDRPVKEHDHAMDALRYFVYTILNNQTAIIRSKRKAGFH